MFMHKRELKNWKTKSHENRKQLGSLQNTNSVIPNNMELMFQHIHDKDMWKRQTRSSMHTFKRVETL